MQPAGDTSLHRSIDASFVPDAFVAAAFEHLHHQIAPAGWGQPWSLWAMVNASGWGDEPLPLGAEAVAIGPLIPEGSGHPYEELFGFAAPEEVFSVILCAESWAYPADDPTGAEFPGLTPGQHPRRRELRCLAAVLADGRIFSRLHFRDGEVVDQDEGAFDGRLLDVLRRALVTPCPAGPRLEALRAAHLFFLTTMLTAGIDSPSALMVSDPALGPALDLGREVDVVDTDGEWIDADSWRALDLESVLLVALGWLLDPETAAWAGPDLGARWILEHLDTTRLRLTVATLQPELLVAFDNVYDRRASWRS
jgi:hypothetical protein